MRLARSIGELEFDGAGALNFEAVLIFRAGCECTYAKACAGVINLKQRDRPVTVIGDRRGNKCGATSARAE